MFVTEMRCAASAPSTLLAPRWSALAVVKDADGERVTPVVDGTTIIVTRSGGISALDADTGTELWSTHDVFDPVGAGPIVYANRQSAPPVSGNIGLTALDVRDGHELWSRPEAGGTLAADDTGVVVGNSKGIARYASDGTQRWNSGQGGGYRRLVVNEQYVVGLSVRSGAILHGEIESIERRTS